MNATLLLMENALKKHPIHKNSVIRYQIFNTTVSPQPESSHESIWCSDGALKVLQDMTIFWSATLPLWGRVTGLPALARLYHRWGRWHWATGSFSFFSTSIPSIISVASTFVIGLLTVFFLFFFRFIIFQIFFFLQNVFIISFHSFLSLFSSSSFFSSSVFPHNCSSSFP